jgi:DNA repair photolyase
MKSSTPDSWKNEIVKPEKLSKGFRKRNGRIMFPTTHDITPENIEACTCFLGHILESRSKVLVVSKPHLECIKKLCDEFQEYKHQILFRFTIGSTDSAVLKFWEPGAPDFEERLSSLKNAFDMGYSTSVSCEPMLDGNIDDLVAQVSLYVTDSIWLGKMNQAGSRLALNGANDSETLAAMRRLKSIQSDEQILLLYSRYKNNNLIKWKESIKKVVGLDIPTKKGLDM